MQSILLEAARQGDEAAMQIYNEAAKELAVSAYAVYNALSFGSEVRIAYSGGVFKPDGFLRGPFVSEVKRLIDGAVISEPELSPEDGALLMAEKQYRCDQK